MNKTFNFNFSIPVVCITFYGRSGSVLLQGLLDNHPQIMSAPAHGLKLLHLFTRDNGPLYQQYDIRTLVNMFAEETPYIFLEADQTKPLRAAGSASRIGVPRARYMEILEEILIEISPKHTDPAAFFRAAHYAYDMALGRDVNKARYIVWQRHAPFWDEASKELFAKRIGNIRILTPLRRPDVTLSSYFEHKNFHADTKSNIKDVNALLELLRLAGYVHKSSDVTCAGVRFEDLHGKTEEVTRSISTWLGIDWHPTMLEPTVDGQEQLFPKDGGIVKGLNKNIESKQRSPQFTWFDRVIYESINRTAYGHWGYPAATKFEKLNGLIAKLGIHIPLRMEITSLVLDLKEMSVKQAIAKSGQRRKETRKELQFILDTEEGKTEYKLLDLLP